MSRPRGERRSRRTGRLARRSTALLSPLARAVLAGCRVSPEVLQLQVRACNRPEPVSNGRLDARPAQFCVPRWAFLLDADPREFRGPLESVSQTALRAGVVGTGAAVMAMLAMSSLFLSTGFALAMAVLFMVDRRFGLVHHFQARREEQARLRHAALERQRIALELMPEQREELHRLESLVESIRWRGCEADEHLLDQLDGLVHAYARLGVELAQTRASFGLTRDDPPTLDSEPPRPDEDPENSMRRRLVRLRVRARTSCRRRIEHLVRKLATIGELVRLIHEERSSAESMSRLEISRLIESTLEESETVRRARDEVESALVAPVPTAS